MVTLNKWNNFLQSILVFKVLDKRITPTLYGWLVSLVPDEYYTIPHTGLTIPGEGGLQIDRETGVYYRLQAQWLLLREWMNNAKTVGIKLTDDIRLQNTSSSSWWLLTAQGNITDNTTGAVKSKH